MHIWSSLIAREAFLLGILLLIGAGPASFLSARFDPAARIAMAPALGFCVATCVMTTLLQFWPTGDTDWVVVVLAVASVTVAAVRFARAGSRARWRDQLRIRDLAALVLVALAVAGPLTATLHSHHTVGPGVYYFTDVDNYVAVQDAARTVSLHTANDHLREHARTGAPWANFTQYTWSFFAQFGSNLDATPLDSNVNALLGLSAVDTFAPFLTVLLLMGAWGAFAAVRYFSQTRTTVAALGGCLFGGALFLELWYDSFQAAIIAIGLILPLALLFDQVRARAGRAELILVALLIATFLSVYPLYVPILAAAAVLAGLWQATKLHRARQPLRPLLRPVLEAVATVVVLSLLFDLVAVFRDLHYYKLLAHNQVPLPRVGYTLPLTVLPGWLAQTREFWLLPGVTRSAKQVVLGLVIPLLFLGLIVAGLRRHPAASWLVAIAAIAGVVGEYTYLSQQSCTYCAERDLLTFAPIVAVLIPLGICALLAMPSQWIKAAAAAAAALVVVSVGQRARVELQRFSQSSWFLTSGERRVIDSVPAGRGKVNLEGFGASLGGQAEQPLVYHYVNYRNPGRTSIIAGSDQGNAIQYLDFGAIHIPPGPEFDPGYAYVLTRLANVETDRRLIAREGGIALMRRTAALDVTPYAGLSVALASVDPSGTAWVQTQTPLQMYVVGRDGGRRAWARLTFQSTVPVTVPRQAGVRWTLSGSSLTVCVPATGLEPLRQANLRLNATLVPGTPLHELFPPAMPLEGVALTAMRAVTGHCSTRS